MGLDEYYWLCRKWKVLHDRISSGGGEEGARCHSRDNKLLPVHSILDMRLKARGPLVSMGRGRGTIMQLPLQAARSHNFTLSVLPQENSRGGACTCSACMIVAAAFSTVINWVVWPRYPLFFCR